MNTKPRLRPKVTSKGTLKIKPKVDENWASIRGNRIIYYGPKMVYQFKITLCGTSPPIWRRILVPERYNFHALHCVIQIAMGWMNCHVHGFEVIDRLTEKHIKLGGPHLQALLAFDADEESYKLFNVEEYSKISRYFKTPGDRGFYTYDYGNDWKHLIEFERRLAPKGNHYPKCIGGERACPLENSGGAERYEHLVTVMADPSHREHNVMKKRLEVVHGIKRFRPEEFDPGHEELFIKFHKL